MQVTVSVFVIIIVVPAALLAENQTVAENQTAPAEQYRELQKAYSKTAGLFRAAKTDQQRKLAVERFDEFPLKFLQFAEKNADDLIVMKALRMAIQSVVSVDSQAQQCWEMNRESLPKGCQNDSAGRIVKVLLRDHLMSDQVAPICDRMRYGLRKEFESFLQTVVEKNPHRNVQGLACLALAQLQHSHLKMLDLAKHRPELIERYEFIFGKGFVQAIRGNGRDALVKTIEARYEQATEFDDIVNIPFKDMVAEKAKSELYEIRHLSVGKLAPDSEGVDQDGTAIALNDYRGKVVLLYFWHEF